MCKSCGRVAVTQLMNEAEEKINYAESETNHSRTQAVDNYTESMGTTLTGDDSLARLTKVSPLLRNKALTCSGKRQ